MKTPVFMFMPSDCLSKEMLDMLIVAKHRLCEENKNAAVAHLQDCAKCRARCRSRVAFLTGTDQVGVLQPDGFLPGSSASPSSPRALFSGAGAGVAAVCILGTALLTPLFLRQNGRGTAPQFRQHKDGKTVTAPRKTEVKKEMLAYMVVQIEGLQKKINKIDAELKNTRWEVLSSGTVRRKALQQQRAMLQKKLVQTKALALRVKNTPAEKLIERY